MTVTPEARWRRVGGQFRSPARLRPAFFARDWNLTGTEEVRDENLQEGAVDIRWGELMRLRSEAGHLALADTFSAVRQSQLLTWQSAWTTGRATWLTVADDVGDASGRLDRKTGTVTLRRWAVWPRVTGLHESRRRALSGGERHREWQAGLLFPAEHWPLRAEFGTGRKWDDSLSTSAGSWRGARETRSVFGTLEGEVSSLAFLARYEARRIESAGGGNERRDVGRLDLRQRAVRGAWTAVANMSVGTVGLRRRTKSIVPADSTGTGYYDRFGNYVGPGGGYDVVYGDRGDETLTGQVELVTRMRWFPPGEDQPIPDWLRRMAWEGYVNLSESSTLPLVTPRYFLSPNSYLDRHTTLDGRLNERQTLDLFPLNRTVGLRLRQEATRRMSQTRGLRPDSPGLVESDAENRYAATVRSNPAAGWDAEVEGSLGNRREEVDLGTEGRLVQDTDLREATVRGGRRVSLFGGSGRVSTEATYSEETGEEQEAIGWVLRPRLQWSRRNVGRLEARYSWTDLTTRRGFTGIRGPGAPNLVEGWRLDLVAELRVNEGIVITAVGALDHPRGIDPLREVRLEVRGSF